MDVLKVIDGINDFYKRTEGDFSREQSWEHCFKQFYKTNNNRENGLSNDDYDILSLYLAFYLASWGDV